MFGHLQWISMTKGHSMALANMEAILAKAATNQFSSHRRGEFQLVEFVVQWKQSLYT